MATKRIATREHSEVTLVSFNDADFSEEFSGPSAKRFKMNTPESVAEGHPGKLHRGA